MNILISGASGFIGLPLTNTLLRKGHKVCALSHKPENARKLLPREVDIMKLNLSDSNAINEKIIDFDAVVNLSGANLADKAWTKKFKDQILSSRINTTSYLADAVVQSDEKPHTFIQGSAIGFYGDKGDETVNENTPRGKGFLADVVNEWEIASKPIKEKGKRLCIIRTGVVIGKGGGIMSKIELPFKFFAGGHFGNGMQWHSWIHLDDEVNAIVHLLENENSEGIYNLTAPDPMRLKGFLKEYGKIVNRPSWLPVPSFALKAFMGERAEELLLVSQKVLPEKLLKEGFEFHYANVGEAFKNIVGN